MRKLFLRFCREEDGQDLIEYALVVALILIYAHPQAGAIAGLFAK